MTDDFESKPNPKEGAAYRFRAPRLWATGQVLGQQLILAQNPDQILSAAFPHTHDWTAPVGERQAARNRIAVAAARMAQDEQIRVWSAGMPGYDHWAMRDQQWDTERALLAPRDQATVDPRMTWPEDGPRLVLARHLYRGAEDRLGVVVWIDPRSAMTLLRSLRGVGLIHFGRI